jgi:Flp pilus assembly protein CpaB
MERAMSRRAQVILGFAALLLAAASGYAVYVFFDRLTTLATLPAPNQVIPAGALIGPEMVTEREAPRALLDEPVYHTAAELVGQVAQVPLQPGMVVYHAFAVPPAAYRLVDDPALVVAALPVDPARAVGGQIQPGHHIDLWQLPQRRESRETATSITPTLVLTDVLVVDVRASSGQAVARRPQAVPGEVAAAETSQQQALPLQILTVALPISRTETLMALIAADRSNDAFLWVALAPLTRPIPPAKALPDPLAALPTPTPSAPPPATPEATLTPIPTPTATATPLPSTATPYLDVRVVTGTGGAPLVVRDAPGGTAIGELAEGAAVMVVAGPVSDDAGTPWYRCTQHGENAVSGWVAAPYLEAAP